MPPKKVTPLLSSKPTATEIPGTSAKSASRIKARPVFQGSKAADSAVIGEVSVHDVNATSFLDGHLDDDIFMDDYPLSLSPSHDALSASNKDEFLVPGVTSFLDNQMEQSDYGSDPSDTVKTVDEPTRGQSGALPPQDSISPQAVAASPQHDHLSPQRDRESPQHDHGSPPPAVASPSGSQGSRNNEGDGFFRVDLGKYAVSLRQYAAGLLKLADDIDEEIRRAVLEDHITNGTPNVQ